MQYLAFASLQNHPSNRNDGQRSINLPLQGRWHRSTVKVCFGPNCKLVGTLQKKDKVQLQRNRETLSLGSFYPIEVSSVSCQKLKTKNFWTEIFLMDKEGAKNLFNFATCGSPAQCPNWQSHPADAESGPGETRQNVLSLAATHCCSAFLKLYFSKCISQNVFFKIYFSKCISQNVFFPPET